MRALPDLCLVEVGHHRHAWRAEHEHHERAGDVGAHVRGLIVDHLETRLPERLTRLDGRLPFALELEEDLAFEHIAEHRTGVTMRPRSQITGRDADGGDHYARIHCD